jgi:hypothetical protein
MEIKAEKITVGKTLLRDQLDEQDKLIEILRGHIDSLEEAISPVILEALGEAGSDERGSDVPSALAPLQHQVMSQYNRINYLIGRLDGIRRRVQV